MDIVSLDARALAAASQVVARVRPGQLAGPTPCRDWTLAGLLAHMVAHNHGFAAAARGEQVPASVWEGAPLGADPAAQFGESADAAAAAFAAAGALERKMELPGLGAFPGPVAVSFHFVDYLIHGWDVAKAIGAVPEPGADLVQAALKMVSRYPDTPQVRGPGAPFAAKVAVPDDAPPLDRLVGLLGRAPSWAPG